MPPNHTLQCSQPPTPKPNHSYRAPRTHKRPRERPSDAAGIPTNTRGRPRGREQQYDTPHARDILTHATPHRAPAAEMRHDPSPAPALREPRRQCGRVPTTHTGALRTLTPRSLAPVRISPPARAVRRCARAHTCDMPPVAWTRRHTLGGGAVAQRAFDCTPPTAAAADPAGHTDAFTVPGGPHANPTALPTPLEALRRSLALARHHREGARDQHHKHHAHHRLRQRVPRDHRQRGRRPAGRVEGTVTITGQPHTLFSLPRARAK
jgi:hypothetical protein